jgi:LysM repeat protein
MTLRRPRTLVLGTVLGVLCARGAHAAPPEAEPETVEPEPAWIRHEVIPGDRLDTIAARYGVSREALIRWNRLDPHKAVIRVGQKLAVLAKKQPGPRRLVTYHVRKGDTWAGIARKHGVEEKLLRRWNKDVPRAFKYGTALKIWVDAPRQPRGERAESTPLPVIDVRGDGYSVGKPNRGKLVRGVQLPDNPRLYTRRSPETLFGTSHTIAHLQQAIAVWRRDSGYEGQLVVSAISRQGGGRFPPHSSHQTGRDVDIRLPVVAGLDHTSAKNSNEVDWDASWALVRALVDTGQVQYVFLEHARQKRLYSAARRAGVTSAQLRRFIQYPNAANTNNGVVRHAEGHTAHIHVRFTCGPGEDRCVSY